MAVPLPLPVMLDLACRPPVTRVCGEVPTDFLHSSIAATPREALRHFSMKWQLAAARHEEVTTKNQSQASSDSSQPDPIAMLTSQAEDIYELVEDDRLWSQE